MKKILLGIIAINLTFISAYLALRSVEPVKADLDNISSYQLRNDYQFRDAVKNIVQDSCYFDHWHGCQGSDCWLKDVQVDCEGV